MSLQINRRSFLQALIAVGAAYALPAKATKKQIDQAWEEAQANPWIFEVDENGTLVEADVPEPSVWADVFDISPEHAKTTQNFIADISGCMPLTHSLGRMMDDEIESLEYALAHNEQELSPNELSQSQLKSEALKKFRDDYEEAWQDWVALEGVAGLPKFKAIVKQWLQEPIDWMQSEWFPLRSGAQGAALGFFESQSYELLNAIGVVIIDGEHPGSSYFAAELRTDVDEANVTAEKLVLPFRFRRPVERQPVKLSAPVQRQPSKLAIAINGSENPAELARIDNEIDKLGELKFATPAGTGEAELIEQFANNLPPVRGYMQGMARQMKKHKFRGNLRAFVHVRERLPDPVELDRLWTTV